ncbi:MAG TPA: hypothetical protein VKZ53_10490 [Candidatus Angelobacter sp.]|nr:hypothetical protein [Candidatus Angelobacter sp.]
MPRTPSSLPYDAPPCDPRLARAALRYRMNTPQLTTPQFLGAINVTAWLYRDERGVEDVQVNANTTIIKIIEQFGPAATPDAEVGIHSEMMAAEWFRSKRGLKVLQIFSERIPCSKMCAPMLKHYFPGIPWYYYYNMSMWREGGTFIKTAGQVLKTVYEL